MSAFIIQVYEMKYLVSNKSKKSSEPKKPRMRGEGLHSPFLSIGLLDWYTNGSEKQEVYGLWNRQMWIYCLWAGPR